ncbi:MAG: hypothetical protein B6D53_01740 [Candidatus Omnitrophica bacterium 4484_49]|nr:DUF4416 family protein [Candidatus Omnitrophota bacterium]OQX83742.1 MAG: hypothetical protein B6D53_01740 [Candidatus Omnitrophica bacterium 4484_49]
MGKIFRPQPVKLIIGIITNSLPLLCQVEKLLQKRYGPIDYHSSIIDFVYTDYYEKEMGEKLKRKFISFEKLIFPVEIIKIKHYTNSLEKKFSHQGKRNINIDPGYLNEGKLILASTKDNLQRVYLGKGIYAEVTLYFRKGEYHPFMWTYPDYCSFEYREIFREIRSIFRTQIGKE